MNTSLKIVTSFAFIALLLTLSPVAFARTRSSVANAEVLGTVLQCGTPIPYVPVQATCGSQTLNGSTGSTTGDNGKYSLTFKNESCQKGATANVSATVDGHTYSNSGTIGTYFFFPDKAWVDIETGSDCGDPQVPEFGALTGVLAAVGSAGSYMLLKRRSV